MASPRTQATPKAGAGTAAGNVPQAAPASVPVPMPMPPRQRAGDTQIPRPTPDDPWRDLHPARVWPD